ncbi:MAG: 2,5-diamino-6-(ribosylamino)-4(3H)-pyrimidinone 5'-phosphate reductase [Candidatus Methanophagaceae archaeon]|nr:MAG: 2,5-diamino-6-(ribosylamino)-4(3H)-pyrimidinone 5'-phosphate reductase [Methanophagales archaeon]
MEKSLRPFVFINAATSADGKISTVERRQTRISGKEDFERVDSLRAGSDAIMVGVGTVLADDPSLTVKAGARRAARARAGKDANPLRVVVDSRARTPPNAEVLCKGEGRRIIAVSELANADGERVAELGKRAEVLVCGGSGAAESGAVESGAAESGAAGGGGGGGGKVDLGKLLARLRQRGVERLLVEGGATLNWSLISQGLVDEIFVYVGNLILGGEDAPTLVDGAGFVAGAGVVKLELLSAERLGEGVLLKWRVVSEGEREKVRGKEGSAAQSGRKA